MAAEGGIMQLVDRGAPPHKLGAEATAAVAAEPAGAPLLPAPPVAVTAHGAAGRRQYRFARGQPAAGQCHPAGGTRCRRRSRPDVPVLLPYRGVPVPR
jgi:hypothetical protein